MNNQDTAAACAHTVSIYIYICFSLFYFIFLQESGAAKESKSKFEKSTVDENQKIESTNDGRRTSDRGDQNGAYSAV